MRDIGESFMSEYEGIDLTASEQKLFLPDPELKAKYEKRLEDIIELPNEKENPLQSMNSRNNIGNASAARSVQRGTTPSRILLPENVPIKTNIVKKYRQKRQEEQVRYQPGIRR